MRILDEKRQDDLIRLYIESQDDLWYLRNIISEGDLVRTTVMRRVEKQTDMVRSKETSRKPVSVLLRVENVDFRPFTSSLKILGVIVGSSDEARGEHQSVSLDEGSSFELIKESWTETQRHMLVEAQENPFSFKGVFVTMDDEVAEVFALRSYGIHGIGTVESGKTGKQFESSYSGEDYFSSIVTEILAPLENLGAIIVLGPGFTREHFVTYLKKNSQFRDARILSYPADRRDLGAVYGFLKSEDSAKLLSNMRLMKEQTLVDTFLKNLNTNELACYGMDETLKSLELSAVDTLMITEELYRSSKGLQLLRMATDTGAMIHVFSSHGDPGIILRKFGDVAGILRFKVSS